LAEQKIQALKCKEIEETLGFDLDFAASPMEAVDELPNCNEAFDAAYVYEALHHAFDWRQTLRATFNVLKPGGWFLLAAEPNRLHTFISYRVAKLSRTHEIGFSRQDLCSELKAAGFATVKVLAPRIDNRVTPHWIIARK
jgi:SAM-dependent methyltransferase